MKPAKQITVKRAGGAYYFLLPRHLADMMGIEEGDPFTISTDGKIRITYRREEVKR